MSDYRRWRVSGATLYLTLVTYQRQPLFTSALARDLLRAAIEQTQAAQPFELFATVLLPDHWHLVINLPSGDPDYAQRVSRIKQIFTRSWIKTGRKECKVTDSQRSRGERGVWQPRFWEHTVRDEDDLTRCVDYIHWNPRKHRLVRRVRDYPWSSFHRFVEAGDYHIDWGGTAPDTISLDQDWGEPG